MWKWPFTLLQWTRALSRLGSLTVQGSPDSLGFWVQQRPQHFARERAFSSGESGQTPTVASIRGGLNTGPKEGTAPWLSQNFSVTITYSPGGDSQLKTIMIRTILPKVQNAFPEACLKSIQSTRPSYLWGRHKSWLWRLLNFCKMHWVFKGCSW